MPAKLPLDGAGVSDLIHIDDDGKTLLCNTASWRTPKSAEGPRAGDVGYWLARVDVDAGIEPITLLRRVFF